MFRLSPNPTRSGKKSPCQGQNSALALTGKASQASGWADFRTLDLGRIEVKQPGEQEVKVRPRDAKTWKAINLRSIRLTPAE